MSNCSLTIPVMKDCVLISNQQKTIVISKFATERVKLMFFFFGERMITLTMPSFRHNLVQHKQGRNTITYRGRRLGVRDQFNIGGVFETTE